MFLSTVDGRSGYVKVDGKQVAKGYYGLTFNEELNAFHWWYTEGQKVYLVSYKV